MIRVSRAVVRTGDLATIVDVSLDAAPASAREIVRRHVTDPLLEDMLFCPVMYYGSAQERETKIDELLEVLDSRRR